VPPERLIPGNDIATIEKTYKERRAVAQKKGRTALVQALDRAIQTRRQQLGGTQGKSSSPVKSPSGKTPLPSSPEKDAAVLLPGKTEQAVRKIFSNRKAAALKKGDKVMAARLDKALPIRLQRLKTQGANVFKVPPERLIPGNDIAIVEKTYKERRAVAQKKGRTALVQALDRAIAVRRQQFGKSSKSTSPSQAKSSTVKVGAETLIPGKTLQEIETSYKQRRAFAVQKKNQKLMQQLDQAYQIRKKQLSAIGPVKTGKKFGSVKNVPPNVLLPGKTLQDVEKVYRQKRSSAQAKGRAELVQALNRAYEIRKKQLSSSPGQLVPKSPGKSPSPGKTPGKSPSPTKSSPVGGDWRKVFGPVDMSNPNPRQVSEKYQALRKAAKDEDVGKLNSLFKKAIQDIKLAKRKKTEAVASVQKAEIEKKKKIDTQIQKDIIQVKRRLSKATVGAQKAQSNIQKFGREIGEATKRRDQAKVAKFKRVIQKRQQNLKRATDARTKATSNLRTLEQKLQGVRSSSPKKLGTSPSPMKSSPPKQTSSPLRLGAPPQKQKSPLKLGAPPAKQQQQSAKKMEDQKRQQQQSAKKVEDQKRQQQQSAKRLEDQKRQSAKRLEDQKRQQQQSARKLEEQKRQSARKVEEQRKRQQQSMKKRSAPMMRPRTPSPIKRRR
jgi:hypothetical protein